MNSAVHTEISSLHQDLLHMQDNLHEFWASQNELASTVSTLKQDNEDIKGNLHLMIDMLHQLHPRQLQAHREIPKPTPLTLMEVCCPTDRNDVALSPIPQYFPYLVKQARGSQQHEVSLGEPDDSERNSSVFDTNPQAQPETHMQGEAICLALKATRIFYKGEDAV